ncbi:MAG: hypothetical protein ACRC2U_15655 [Aeromonas sp.]
MFGLFRYLCAPFYTMRYLHPSFVVTAMLIGAGLLQGGSCTSDQPPVSQRATQLASAYCECAAPIAVLDRSIATLPDTSSQYAIQLNALQQAFDGARNCLGPVMADLAPITKTDLDQVQVVLGQKCPDLAKNRELLDELMVR